MRETIELVSDLDSPLGRSRHRAAVARRLRLGLPGAYQSGARRYLTPDAVAEEQRRPRAPRRRRRGALDPIQREQVGVERIEHLK